MHYYKKGSDFVKYANRMIEKNIRFNNEFYVSQVYNEYILDLKKIIHYPIVEIFSINTPEELKESKSKIEEYIKLK